MESRKIFEAILYALRTGCPWRSLPKRRFGSSASIHKHFREWEEAGFFVALWNAGLAEHDEMASIAWHWKGREKAQGPKRRTGPDVRDQGEKLDQPIGMGRCTWNPVVEHRRGGKFPKFP
jgi:transposase